MSELQLNWEEYLRLGAALLLGAIIGFERELHDKPAGLKTIAIVTLAGCLLSLLSIKLGALATGGPTQAVDISRLAAGVVTGIGFIGAGTIIQSRHHTTGVTTAAVIWLMSAVGMALGAGFYDLAIAAFVLGWIGLSLDPLGARIMHSLNLKQRVIRSEARQHALEEGGPFGLEPMFEDESEEEQPPKLGGTRQSLQKRPPAD
jgi:putative Mg2+ transporter-C (MgtC) family protein